MNETRVLSFSSLCANQASDFKKKPQRGLGFLLPLLLETLNGSVLTIAPANYRKLNTPRQLCGFACRAGKTIWEIQTFPERMSLELCPYTRSPHLLVGIQGNDRRYRYRPDRYGIPCP